MRNLKIADILIVIVVIVVIVTAISAFAPPLLGDIIDPQGKATARAIGGATADAVIQRADICFGIYGANKNPRPLNKCLADYGIATLLP
jgi:hypothetical protein